MQSGNFGKMLSMPLAATDVVRPAAPQEVAPVAQDMAVVLGEARTGMARKPVQMALKRGLDIIISLTALIVLAPLFLVIAALIRYDSKGPALFTQNRWGKDGKVIRIYKFRSMFTDLGDATGVAQTRENDPRVTRVGAVLRKTNIDELPQLINVLKGDMSLVGPRCHAIGMQAAGKLYEELVPEYHQRHVVRPGLTGLAQMKGFRGPTDTEYKARQRVVHDLTYIKSFSLWLDLKIMVGTLINEIKGGTGF